MLSKKCTI